MSDTAKTLMSTVVGGLIAAVASAVAVAITTHQAATAESRRALGAARLLVDDLRRAEGDLGNSLVDCRYELNDVNIDLTPDGLALLAWRFPADQWLPVALAISALKVQIARSHVNHRFTHDDVIQIQYVINQIDRAGPPLTLESGESLFTKQQVKVATTLNRVGRTCKRR